MRSFRRCFALLLVLFFSVRAALAQDGFNWTHSSIGGGGFCMEIRFAPNNFFGLPHDHSIYVATDVAGVFRSTGLDANHEVTGWERLYDANPPSEKDALNRYTTSLAFTNSFNNTPNSALIAGSKEGIYIWDESANTWRAPLVQPDRSSLSAAGLSMNPNDGLYPWISIVRECPYGQWLICAGVGDSRNDQYGLGIVLRSRDGGNIWESVVIDGAANTEIVYDIDYALLTSGSTDYTFITTGGGVYFSNNFFSPGVLPDDVNFTKISGSGSNALPVNTRNLVVLGDNAVQAGKTSGPLLLFATVYDAGDVQVGGVYKASTSIAQLNAGIMPVWTKMPATDVLACLRLRNIAAKPGSMISSYELFLGKQNIPCLAVATESDQTWRIVYEDPEANNNNLDNGYRADPTYLMFGTFDFDRVDEPFDHPRVFGAWKYGPFISQGHNNSAGTHAKPRTIEQMFTTDFGNVTNFPSGDKKYRSRGALDEVWFTGCMVTFDPSDANTMMVSCVDNFLLRSEDGGQHWSQRQLRSKASWNATYGSNRQEVFHIAYHPLHPNYKLVLASAGIPEVKNTVDDPIRGEILRNLNGGAGDENSWQTLAGGPTELADLKNSDIRGFAFDAQDNGNADRNGLFVAVWGKGLFYGKVDITGAVTQNFQKITDPLLNAKIPYALDGDHHNYTRIMFDPYQKDHLYVARGWQSGGVFRLRLKPNRINLNPNDCLEGVDEVIWGRYNATDPQSPPNPTGARPGAFIPQLAGEVINLLITPTAVFAGVATGVGSKTTGGLIRWEKQAGPPTNWRTQFNTWKIGGPSGNPSTTIFIGGLAHHWVEPNTIYAVTYREKLQQNNTSGQNTRYQGEDNYNFMNLWVSTDDGASFTKAANSGLKFPDAASMALSFGTEPGLLKLVVPTHGNGIWIGTKIIEYIPKSGDHGPLEEENNGIPKQFALYRNYPNPFNPTTTIKYDLPKAANVRLVIYDVLGRQVRILVDQAQEAGYYLKVWDGRDAANLPVAAGVYLSRLESEEFVSTQKMVFLP